MWAPICMPARRSASTCSDRYIKSSGRGLPQPACGVCISPWVDLEASGRSMTTKAAEDPMVQREPLLQMAATYLGGNDARSPLAAPLHADLRGLPPLLIQVGSAEVLLDDAVPLAAGLYVNRTDPFLMMPAYYAKWIGLATIAVGNAMTPPPIKFSLAASVQRPPIRASMWAH